MKYLLIVLFPLLFACEKKEIPFEITPERFGKTSFRVYENARIKRNAEFEGVGLAGAYEILEGNKLVFEYIFVKDDDPQIADDEFSETMVFETDPGITEVTFKDGDILKQNAVYTYSCYCVPVNGLDTTEGTIHVKKKSAGSYQVEADVKFLFNAPENFQNDIISWEVDFNETFIKK